ncbi:MAG TPA: Hsp20/alpha crystallin family protein [Draconibacterium sp.]|nr:Hsp20/alpha crystallin family protein [Draconibacterium sp.]
MNLVRFQHPRYNVNRVLVDELFNNFFNNDYHENYVRNCGAAPATNVFETETDFRIELSLPGYAKEDVQLINKDNLLTIKVEKEKTEDKETFKYMHREFGAYNFEKQYRLPKTVDAENISAKFENGILSVVLPKKEEAKEKEAVEIKIL